MSLLKSKLFFQKCELKTLRCLEALKFEIGGKIDVAANLLFTEFSQDFNVNSSTKIKPEQQNGVSLTNICSNKKVSKSKKDNQS